MRVLLDTNIIIHRETNSVINSDIGILFRWIDNLRYTKCVHPITVEELNKYKDPKTVKSMSIKLDSYNLLRTEATWDQLVVQISKQHDKNQNDLNDTKLLNELVKDRVDILITEDRKIAFKAIKLGVGDRVFTIDSFLEKVTSENPTLLDYKVLSVKKELMGNININDAFFDSLKEDYPGFERWFNRKADETAYICTVDEKIMAFLYLKMENKDENYSNITPTFQKKRRLKIGTFKVTLNGYKLGERFLKIIFDNAVKFNVDEIYVTIFDNRIEQIRLIHLLQDFGFVKHGLKDNIELVYVRDFQKITDHNSPKITYPFFSCNKNMYITPIYPDYHTELFPDSILRTESPQDFIENEPHRNAISKVYISRSIEKNLNAGDIIVFYRTGGYYKSVVTTIGVVESVIKNISNSDQFISLCKKRSVFNDVELLKHWNYNEKNRPFIVNFLYTYSLPKRINMKRLIELGVLKGVQSAPRGFQKIGYDKFKNILEEAEVDESIVVY